jgi:DnaJ-class molecular chaperone
VTQTLIDKRTLYDVLGVEPNAPVEKIRAIYRWRSRQTYPRSPGVGNEELQKQLNGAYNILQDPEKRREYNEKMGLPLKPRPLKPGKPTYQEISVDTQDANRPISYVFTRWEPCSRCWGEGCTRCQGRGKTLETVRLCVTVPAGVSQFLVEGQGTMTEPGSSRGDLILYVIWEDKANNPEKKR